MSYPKWLDNWNYDVEFAKYKANGGIGFVSKDFMQNLICVLKQCYETNNFEPLWTTKF